MIRFKFCQRQIATVDLGKIQFITPKGAKMENICERTLTYSTKWGSCLL